MRRTRLLVSDIVLSFMWVWSEAVVKIFVHKCMGFSHEAFGKILKNAFSIMNTIFCLFLEKITDGGSYNPLSILAYSIFGDFINFLYCIGARIPAQELYCFLLYLGYLVASLLVMIEEFAMIWLSLVENYVYVAVNQDDCWSSATRNSKVSETLFLSGDTYWL